MPGNVSLKGIEFVIKGETDGASSSIDKLIGKLGSLQKALADTSNVKKLSTGLSGLKKAINEFGQADIKGAVSSLKELGKVSKSLEGLANMSRDLAAFAKSMSKLAESPENLAAVAAALSSIAKIDFSNLATAGEGLKNIVSAINSLSNRNSGSSGVERKVSIFERLGTVFKSFSKTGIGKTVTRPFMEAWKSAKGFYGSIKGVIGGFTRILGYRMIRTVIKEISQAFQEGIKNLYGWSAAFGGAMIHGKNFAETMDAIATSFLYFKNSAGAAVAPLISALAPALDYVIDKVVTLLNLINQLIARLAGATSWNKATKKATQFGAAAGGAGEKAKEAMRYLAPFDELNRLPAEHDGGGGGGGGGADFDGMFEEVAHFNEELADFADRIRDAVDRGDWEGLGKIIGDKINELVDRIDFAGIGTKIGEKINALFTTEYWTLKTINFQNIGAKIAEFLTGENGIGGALRAIDFRSIGGILAEKLTMLPDIIIGIINTLDFSVIGKSVGDFLREFAEDIAEFVDNTDWGELFENVVKAIVDFFEGLDVASLAQSVLKLLGSVVGAVSEGLGTLLIDVAEIVVNPDTWKLVWAWLEDLPAKFKNAAINIANSFASPLIEKWNSLVERFNESGFSKFLGYNLKKIEFDMIPNIPEEELNKHYNQAKAELEAEAAKNPVNFKIKSTAVLTEVKDKTKARDRVVSDVTASVENVNTEYTPIAEIKGVGRVIDAKVDSRVRTTIPAEGEVKTAVPKLSSSVQISATGIIEKTAQNLKAAPVIPSTGNIKNTTLGLAANPIITAVGMIASVAQSLASKPIIDSIGNIKSTKIYDQITKPSITSVGDIKSTTQNLSSEPDIPSIGNIKRTKQNISTTPSITSVGDIISASVSDAINKPKIDSEGSIDYLTYSGAPNYIITPGYIDYDSGGTESYYGEPGTEVAAHNNPDIPHGYTDRLALGGAYYGGAWHDIPQAATGGKFHGSLFWAGESGAELVGHAGGRTEVLNRSQLASTMYAAVTAGIARTLGGMVTSVTAPTAVSSDGGMSEDTLYRAFLRALNDADNEEVIELDGDVVYKKMVQRNRQNTRRTGVNAMMAT